MLKRTPMTTTKTRRKTPIPFSFPVSVALCALLLTTAALRVSAHFGSMPSPRTPAGTRTSANSIARSSDSVFTQGPRSIVSRAIENSSPAGMSVESRFSSALLGKDSALAGTDSLLGRNVVADLYRSALNAQPVGVTNAALTASSVSSLSTSNAIGLEQTITVDTHAPASAAYNSTFTVAATSNSTLSVVYSSAGSCTNDGPLFTMTSGSGTCTVNYDQPGDETYNP